jgi:hypothetical protein
VTSIVAEIPAYAALTESQLAEVTAIAEWGTARVLQLWVEDGELSPADVNRFQGIGAARALDGRPLPGVLRAYRLAGNEIFALVEQLGRDTMDLGDVVALTRLWMATIDTLSEALYAGHVAAADRATGDRSLAVGDLVEDLLLGRQVTRTGLVDRLRELGLSLGPTVALLVVRARDSNTAVSPGALESLLADTDEDHSSSMLTRVRDDGMGIAVVSGALTVDPGSLTQRQWRGCLMSELKVADLPRAFRLGSHFLDHAPNRAFAKRSLLNEADAQVLALLTGHDDADPERLSAQVMQPLRTSSGDHLHEGLMAYLETGSAAEAAKLLHVHPQTMRYRLRRISELTGRHPGDGWDRLVLEASSLAPE